MQIFYLERSTRFRCLRSVQGNLAPRSLASEAKCGKIYSECIGKIVIWMLDNSRKVDILKFRELQTKDIS